MWLLVAGEVVIGDAQRVTTVYEAVESIHVLGQSFVGRKAVAVLHKRVVVGLQLLELDAGSADTAQAH
jgi:hypothetical protein